MTFQHTDGCDTAESQAETDAEIAERYLELWDRNLALIARDGPPESRDPD